MIVDGNIVFGIRIDPKPPVFANMPPGVLRVRIKERCDCETRVYLKFADRIEEWQISNGAAGEWVLEFPVRANRAFVRP